METYFTTFIVLNVICSISFLVSAFQRKRKYYYSIAIANAGLVFYHWATWQYHLSTTLNDALHYSTIQELSAIIISPLLTYTFGHWSRFKYTNIIVSVYFLLLVSFVISTFVLQLPLKDLSTVVLSSFENIFGETVHILNGELSPFYAGLRLLVALSSLLLFVFAVKLLQIEKSAIAYVLFATTLLTAFIIYVAFKVEAQTLPLFYIGGLPPTFASLIILFVLISSFKKQEKRISSEYEQRLGLKTALKWLAVGINVENINDFYRQMLSTIQKQSGADIVFVGKRNEDAFAIDTLTVLANGELIDNFSYDLKGAPCEVVVTKSLCVYPSGLLQQFPEDQLLIDHQIKAYIGQVIIDENDNSIGVIALLFKNDIDSAPDYLDTLKVFAARTSAEMRRDKADKKIKNIAYQDYMSQLPNRANLLEKIDSTYLECKESGHNAMLLLLDIDHFGEINRKYGSEVGDQVIVYVSQQLTSLYSPLSFIARSGSDEFAILLTNVDETRSLQILQEYWTRLNEALSTSFIIERHSISISCSFGAVSFPSQINTRYDVIGATEKALQQAKANGQGQFSLFDPKLSDMLDYKRKIERDLAQALHNPNELYLVYQPKVSADTTVVGAEALMRWDHKDEGKISPSVFIPIAEQSGLIHDVGKWLVKKVCHQFKHWQELGLVLYPISINVSAAQFDTLCFGEFLIENIKAFGLTPALFEIEITETDLLADTSNAKQHIKTLRQQGVSVSLDDFGTGYSSLSYLHVLPINVLKIDKSFVDNIHEQQSMELVKTIIAIGNAMNLKIIAEGTETDNQVSILTALGCEYFQGYFFSKPLKPQVFREFCTQSNDT